MTDEPGQACRWCGALHGVLCPYVKAMEFSEANGIIVTRVEFVTMADFPAQRSEPEADAPDGYDRIKPGWGQHGEKK